MTDEGRFVMMGTRRYRVEAPWGKLPEPKAFGQISQVAVDSWGRVYVLQRSNPPVLIFDAAGDNVGALGSDRIIDPHGIFISPDDRIFVVDRDAHQIVIFAADGSVLNTIGSRGRPCFGGPFNHPTDVATASDGEIYVTDGYGNSRVHRFTANGSLIGSWGEPGKAPGQFSTPHAVWVDRQNRVLVADRENDRVQVFDRDGRYLESWTDFFHPMDIFEDADGMIFVTDQVPRVSMLSGDGRLVGRSRPAMNGAHGIWGDRDGSIYLAEMIPSRMAKLVPL